MRRSPIAWFLMWISWYIVILPAVHSEEETIKGGQIEEWNSGKYYAINGPGQRWFLKDNIKFTTCGIGNGVDFWMVTSNVNLNTTFADIIHVDVEAELTLCYDPGTNTYLPCYTNYFEVYIYRETADNKDIFQPNSPATLDDFLNVYSPLYNITNNTSPNSTLTRSIKTFSFLKNNSQGVAFAIRSRGACGSIFNIKMYYYYCKERFFMGIKFERTPSPAQGFKNVTGICSEYTIPLNNATANIHCYPNGTWSEPDDENLKCLCIEGFARNKTDGLCSNCSNTSYKKKISNEICTECPMNTLSSTNKTSCVCKDGYYKSSSDKSELSPCYALPVLSEKPKTRRIAYGVELSWTTPRSSLNETILYNVKCFIYNWGFCNITTCMNETYDPSPNKLSQTKVTVSNLIAGERYVFRVYARNSLNDAVPENEWRYTETAPVNVIPDSVKEKTDDPSDDSSRIIIIIVTTVAVFLGIVLIVLLVKYKRLKRALKLLTPVNIPLETVETPQESLPIGQEVPGYEAVPRVVRETNDNVNRNANNSEGMYEKVEEPSDARKTSEYETPGENKTYEKPETSSQHPGYAELDKNRMEDRNTTDDSNYQKLVKRDSDCVIPTHERRESYEDIKMGRNQPGYTELDQIKREAEDYPAYQKLANT